MENEKFQVAIFRGVVTVKSELPEAPAEEETEEEIQALVDEESSLAAQRDAEAQKLADLAQSVKNLETELARGSGTLAQRLIQLQIEERILIDKQLGKTFESDADADADNPFADKVSDDDPLKDLEADDSEVEQPGDRHKKKVKNLLEKVKKIFRKITMRTHPDRTPNKAMHSLFRQAVRARENMDLEALELIYKQAISGKLSLLNALLMRVEVIKAELVELRMTLNYLILSDGYRMYRDWQDLNNRAHIQQHYNIVERNIEDTISKIRMLDPTRYPTRKPALFNKARPPFDTGSSFWSQDQD